MSSRTRPALALALLLAASAPALAQVVQPQVVPPIGGGPSRLGVYAQSVPVQIGGQWRPALQIVSVDWSGPAIRAGLEPGDIIVSVNGVPATDIVTLRRTVAYSYGVVNLVIIDVRRPGVLVPVVVYLGYGGGSGGPAFAR